MHKHIEIVADRYGFQRVDTGRGPTYVKVLAAGDLPYASAHIVDNETVFDTTQVRFELEFRTGRMMIRQIIDDIQDLEEQDVNTEDGAAMLVESAGKQPELGHARRSR
jgi:hypothetical protein